MLTSGRRSPSSVRFLYKNFNKKYYYEMLNCNAFLVNDLYIFWGN
jgi:hypothetical protein